MLPVQGPALQTPAPRQEAGLRTEQESVWPQSSDGEGVAGRRWRWRPGRLALSGAAGGQ